MGSISDYMENAWFDHVFGHSTINFTNLYVGLSTADPTDDASGMAEVSGGSYARQACFGAANWDAAATRHTANTNQISFPQATAAWGTVTHYFICDHLSNTTWGTDVNLIAHGSLSTAKSIVSGNTASIAAGQIEISVNASGASGGMHDYLVEALLNLTFRDVVYTAPTVHCALCTGSQPTDAGSYTEVANASNYARVQHTGSTNWDAAATGHTQNNNAITFPTPSGSWGTVTYAMLLDASTHSGGNPLFNGQVTSQTPDNGDTVQFADGSLDLNCS